MSTRFVNIDRETPMLFPVDMREWLPENHLVHFIIDAINQIGVSGFKVNHRGSGSEQFPPEMMLALLIYSYVTRRFGSRTIEAATYTDVALRYICADKAHPDHSVICQFRKDNKEVFEDTFTKVLLLARHLGLLKRTGGNSVDGSKFRANASKHKAVSYKRAGEIIEELRGQVSELMKIAEDADEKVLEEGIILTAEIQRREDRIANLEAARVSMEHMYAEAKAEGVKKGKKLDEYQHNFTDSDSRIMKAGSGKHFEQCYNAQAAVDTEGSMLILGGYVTQNVNDKKELEPSVASVSAEVREVTHVSADSGFYSEAAVAAVEKVNEEGKREGPEVFCAVEKGKHGKTVDDLKKKSSEEDEPIEDESTKDKKEVDPFVSSVPAEVREEPHISVDSDFYSETALVAVGKVNEAGKREGPKAFWSVEKSKHWMTVDDLKKKAAKGRPPDKLTEKEKMARKLKSKEGKAIYKKRKETVEPVFGIIKHVMGFRQFMLRGTEKVNTEWSLVRLAYNFKRLHNLMGKKSLSEYLSYG